MRHLLMKFFIFIDKMVSINFLRDYMNNHEFYYNEHDVIYISSSTDPVVVSTTGTVNPQWLLWEPGGRECFK